MSRIITTKPPPGAQVDRGNPINDKLRAWWPFNEGAGPRVTDIVSGNDGIAVNMNPANDWVGSIHGRSLDFDGTDDYLRIDSPTPELDTVVVSIGLWINLRASGVQVLVAMYNGSSPFSGYGVSIGVTGGSQKVNFWDSVTWKVGAGSADIPLNEWTHVYIGRSALAGAGKGHVFINGRFDSDFGPSPGDTYSGERAIGAAQGGASFTDAQISDVQIFAREPVLSHAQELHDSPYGGILRRGAVRYFVPAVAAAAFIPDNRFRRFASILAQ